MLFCRWFIFNSLQKDGWNVSSWYFVDREVRYEIYSETVQMGRVSSSVFDETKIISEKDENVL